MIAALALLAGPHQDPADTGALGVPVVEPPGQDSLGTSPDEPGQVSEQQVQVDEAIQNSLQAVFDRVPSLAEVEVVVDAGVIRLSGTVLDEEIRERAIQLAAETNGAIWVENEIALETSLSRQLQPTWDRLRDLGYGVVGRLPLYAVALSVVVFSILAGAVLGRWGGPNWLQSRNPFLRNLFGRAIQTIVVIAGLLVALDLIEATALVGAVAGTAGLAGLAVGFAFKDIVENYLAGLLLAFRQPFSVNDHVLVGGHEGKIVRLTPRETVLMTLEGNHARIPNATVFRNGMLNYTRNPRRRFQFDVGVSPVDDLASARTAGLEVLRDMGGVLVDPEPEALVVGLGDSWVTIRFLGWVDQRESDFLRVRSEAIRMVKHQLETAGVSLPSPEYVVRIAGGTDIRSAESQAEDAVPIRMPASDLGAEEVPRGQGDVSRDDSVERQIAEDRQRSGEQDLLE